MQDVSTNNSLQFIDMPLDQILSNADYQEGFTDGIGAYQSECEEKGRTLSGREVCKDISNELNPGPRQRAAIQASEALFGCCENHWYTSGFLAGWIHAHLLIPATPAAALPETQPLAIVLPFRSGMQHERQS